MSTSRRHRTFSWTLGAALAAVAALSWASGAAVVDDIAPANREVLLRLVEEAIINESAKLLPSDGNFTDQFGTSVAVSGDTAVGGATEGSSGGTGKAYVFVRSGTTWSEQAKLLASDGGFFDSFGLSVAVSGGTAVVGAPFADDNGGASGSAYVFVRSGTSWSEQAKLLPHDGAENDRFGLSVSVSGDTAVVGMENNLEDNTQPGSAYVFVRSETSWSEEAKLLASDAVADDAFGSPVAISGDTVVVGAPFADVAGLNSGSAYVFVRSGTSWSEQAKLLPHDGAAIDWFGASVAISGDTAVVAAKFDDDSGESSGSAYVFVRSGTSWSEQAKLLPSDGAASDVFGTSVSVSGNTVVVGAEFDDDSGESSGSAYIFVRSGTSWSELAKLLASDGIGSDRLGESVSVSGDTAVVGVPSDGDNGTGSGSAYVFPVGSLELAAAGDCPGDVTLSVTGATPAAKVRLFWAKTEGSFVLTSGPCEGTELGLANPRTVALLTADESGVASFTRTFQASQCGRFVQAVDVATCTTSSVVTVAGGSQPHRWWQ